MAVGDVIAKTGASAIRAISSVSPSIGGKIGKAVDVVGKALGNPLPEYGATEYAESRGGQPAVNATPAQRVALEQKAQTRAGTPSAYGVTQQRAAAVSQPNQQASVNPNSVSELRSERAMGANVGDIRDFGGQKFRWNGEVWEQEGGGGGQVAGTSTQNASDVLGGYGG